MIMPRLILLLAFLLVPLQQAGAGDRDYDGPDGGFLIYSAGSIRGPINFAFRYKRIRGPAGGAASDWGGTIGCGCVGFIRAQAGGADYQGRETGRVHVRRLPPGDYEVFNFGFSGSLGTSVVTTSSARPFSIPFTIRPGGAVYIGSFARTPSLGTPLQRELGAMGFFVIANRAERDLAIARRQRPELPEPVIAFTDVSGWGNAMLRSDEPQ
jgi:hypothetical protein